MAGVIFEGVTKRFGDTIAVDSLNLEVSEHEFVVLLGPSGCGKTTALRMVAGLEDPSEGLISIGDRVVNDVEPKDRDVAMVFQSYALYPHMSVQRNIEFPLRKRGFDKAAVAEVATRVATSLGLGAMLDRKPGQLSGGQRQRVALARAIVRQPLVFLMDEPLSNLDAALRTQTRADIVSLQERLGTTMLYVTHDQVEAMTMADRIAIMDRGVLKQVGTPQDIYDRPADLFVAGFIGSPPMNTFAVVGSPADGGTWVLKLREGSIPLREPLASLVGGEGGGPLMAGVRPENMSISADGTLETTVTLVELLGYDVHVVCQTEENGLLIIRQDITAPRPKPGERVRVAIQEEGVHLFDRDTGLRIQVET
jgi:multiple sugar transport system ATP-binding protein